MMIAVLLRRGMWRSGIRKVVIVKVGIGMVTKVGFGMSQKMLEFAGFA
jgi:hypothetical protein